MPGALEAAGAKAKLIQLTHTGFDEATLGELVIHMSADCDLVVAVGLGAINDMVRFSASKWAARFSPWPLPLPWMGLPPALPL